MVSPEGFSDNRQLRWWFEVIEDAALTTCGLLSSHSHPVQVHANSNKRRVGSLIRNRLPVRLLWGLGMRNVTRNPSNREIQIPGYNIKINWNPNLNLYHEILRNPGFSNWWISGCSIFSRKCYRRTAVTKLRDMFAHFEKWWNHILKENYQVATIGRLLRIIGLFCKRVLS